MRDLFLFGVFGTYLALGTRAPFVLVLGYLWVDFMNPQQAAYSLFSRVPVSLVMACAAVLGFIFLVPTKLKKENWPSILMLLWAAWMTITLSWAEVPSAAWEKWDWAFKTACFTAFLPLMLRTRIHLEAMLLTIVFSLSAAFMAGGVKTIVTGGGYGQTLGLFGGNAGIVEGATLACLAAACIPIFLYANDSRLIIENKRRSFVIFYGLIAACVIAAVGTFERTGLVSLAALAAILFPTVKRKFTFAALLILVGSLSGYLLSERWFHRMDTINSYQGDASAMERIEVWKWTLDYVHDHPLGGGFNVYKIDHVSIPVQTGIDKYSNEEVSGVAFHSIWFEVLGEQGIPGFALFVAMIAAFYVNNFKTMSIAKNQPELRWARKCARCLMTSTTVYLIGGSFIGIAFQPFLYDLFAAAIVLRGCVSANVPVTKPSKVPVKWKPARA